MTLQGLSQLFNATEQQLDLRIRTVDGDIRRLQQEQDKSPSLLSSRSKAPMQWQNRWRKQS
jgi:hypothetical protein